MDTIMDTIKEAKRFLRTYWNKGVSCPCCGQMVKLYKVKFNSNMAIFLITLVKLYQKEKRPIHYSECNFTSRNYPYIAKWKLAKTTKDESGNKRTSGYWEPTELGIKFAKNITTIPSYINIFDNKVTGFSGAPISIKKAIGIKFNYNELMYGS